MSTVGERPQGLWDVLLVEDDPGDVLMTREALEERQVPARLHVVSDGVEALAFLRHEEGFESSPTPDLILLDLNLPRLDGREVLAQVKSDVELRRIPVVVLSTSEAPDDVRTSYHMFANAYVSKPSDFDRYTETVGKIDKFFAEIVRLPSRPT